MDESTLKSKKVAELRSLLKSKGLEEKGVKAVLIQRLLDSEEVKDDVKEDVEDDVEDDVKDDVKDEDVKSEPKNENDSSSTAAPSTATAPSPAPSSTPPISTKKRPRSPSPSSSPSKLPKQTNEFGHFVTTENKRGARPTRPDDWKVPGEDVVLPRSEDVEFPPLEPVQLSVVKTVETSDSEHKCTMKINARYVGRVLGRGGETVRDLQNRCACAIDLDQTVAGDEKHITLTGPPSNLAKGKYLLSLLCCEYGYELPLPLLLASTSSIEISDFVVGTVIGPSGKMIKHLQNITCTRIMVAPKTPHSNVRTVTFTGKPESDRDILMLEEGVISLISGRGGCSKGLVIREGMEGISKGSEGRISMGIRGEGMGGRIKVEGMEGLRDLLKEEATEDLSRAEEGTAVSLKVEVTEVLSKALLKEEATEDLSKAEEATEVNPRVPALPKEEATAALLKVPATEFLPKALLKDPATADLPRI
ncbi:hypothetical protein TrVE_jg9737 [Triparma verrucosa]|uniref:SAP domain-containing protein n=1 Tax=Triparma verrucosa TaxID=1606542 RepID=A0A9W7C6Z9_9STRA|nr:hypothetical protein TrVE_jg9737 [Triparma verrucosa]